MEHKNLEEKALRMLAEKNYTARGFGAKVRMNADKAEAFLEDLADKGKISRSKTARKTSYYVQPVVSVDPRMPIPYKPEFKEYRYDLGAFARMCEGSRNSERGFV